MRIAQGMEDFNFQILYFATTQITPTMRPHTVLLCVLVVTLSQTPPTHGITVKWTQYSDRKSSSIRPKFNSHERCIPDFLPYTAVS